MRKKGFTLVEILLAVAIVAVLTVVLLISTSGLRRESQIRFTESTLGIIMTALQQYHEFWGDWPPQVDDTTTTTPDPWSKTAIRKAMGATGLSGTWPPAGHSDDNTFSEALYLRLYRTPPSRKIIDRMPSGPKLINKPQRKTGRMLVFDPLPTATDYPNTPTSVKTSDNPSVELNLYRFVDAWENPLRYEYRKQGQNIPGTDPVETYKTTDQFPTVRSAGPDGVFNTADDILSGRM